MQYLLLLGLLTFREKTAFFWQRFLIVFRSMGENTLCSKIASTCHCLLHCLHIRTKKIASPLQIHFGSTAKSEVKHIQNDNPVDEEKTISIVRPTQCTHRINDMSILTRGRRILIVQAKLLYSAWPNGWSRCLLIDHRMTCNIIPFRSPLLGITIRAHVNSLNIISEHIMNVAWRL